MTDPVVEEEIKIEAIEKATVETHTKKQKESILKTITSTIWLWVEELTNTISSESKKETPKHSTEHQITPEIEKEELALIKKRGIHEE